MSLSSDWFEVEKLHFAAQDGNVEEISRLVQEGFEVNQFDDLSRTPLHYAVEGEHYRAAKWLLDNGASVNANETEKIGETPLSLAVQGNYPEMVELLLKYGANPDIPGWMSITARQRAKKRKDEEGLKINEILSKSSPAL